MQNRLKRVVVDLLTLHVDSRRVAIGALLAIRPGPAGGPSRRAPERQFPSEPTIAHVNPPMNYREKVKSDIDKKKVYRRCYRLLLY